MKENLLHPNFHFHRVETLREALARVHYLLGDLQKKIAVFDSYFRYPTHETLSLKDRVRLDMLTKDVIKSAELEGVFLNGGLVRSLVSERLGIKPSESHDPSCPEAGAVEVMLDAVLNYQAPLTQKRLLGWHASLFAASTSDRIVPLEAGRYRSWNIELGTDKESSYVPPSGEKVQAEMKEFLNWMKQETGIDPVLMAGIAHFWFMSIFPFGEGNQRIAQAISSMLLARHQGSSLLFYSLPNQIIEDKKQEYYVVLRKAQKGDGSITLWLEWFLLRVEHALVAASRLLGSLLLVEKAAKEHQEREYPQFNGQDMAECLQSSFVAGAKWAKVWIPVKEELPQPGTAVLLKGGILSITKSLLLENDVCVARFLGMIEDGDLQMQEWGLSHDIPGCLGRIIAPTHWRHLEYERENDTPIQNETH